MRAVRKLTGPSFRKTDRARGATSSNSGRISSTNTCTGKAALSLRIIKVKPPISSTTPSLRKTRRGAKTPAKSEGGQYRNVDKTVYSNKVRRFVPSFWRDRVISTTKAKLSRPSPSNGGTMTGCRDNFSNLSRMIRESPGRTVRVSLGKGESL